jgi:hypothetical protein
MIIAHAGHWITSVAYFAPVLGFMIWLGVTTYRARRDERNSG